MSDMPTLPRRFPGGILRRMRAPDLRGFQAYRAIPELGRYQGWSPMTDAEASAFIEEMVAATLFTPGEWVQLAIAAAPSDAIIGDLGLYLSEDASSGEVGFTLAPAAQGRGIATAAVREALRLCFECTPAAIIRAVTDVRNTPSMRLLQRLDFALVDERQAEFRGEQCTERVYEYSRIQQTRPGCLPSSLPSS